MGPLSPEASYLPLHRNSGYGLDIYCIAFKEKMCHFDLSSKFFVEFNRVCSLLLSNYYLMILSNYYLSNMYNYIIDGVEIKSGEETLL